MSGSRSAGERARRPRSGPSLPQREEWNCSGPAHANTSIRAGDRRMIATFGFLTRARGPVGRPAAGRDRCGLLEGDEMVVEAPLAAAEDIPPAGDGWAK